MASLGAVRSQPVAQTEPRPRRGRGSRAAPVNMIVHQLTPVYTPRLYRCRVRSCMPQGTGRPESITVRACYKHPHCECLPFSPKSGVPGSARRWGRAGRSVSFVASRAATVFMFIALVIWLGVVIAVALVTVP